MTMQHDGYVLFVTLLFLFILTLIVVSGSQDLILENKMQSNMQNQLAVFSRAELGLRQAILAQEGDSISLPDSSIALTVTTNTISVDDCGNQTIDFQAIAKNAISTVVLNSRDIFAKVPRQKRCRKIPAHHNVWWNSE